MPLLPSCHLQSHSLWMIRLLLEDNHSLFRFAQLPHVSCYPLLCMLYIYSAVIGGFEVVYIAFEAINSLTRRREVEVATDLLRYGGYRALVHELHARIPAQTSRIVPLTVHCTRFVNNVTLERNLGSRSSLRRALHVRAPLNSTFRASRYNRLAVQ